MKHYQGVRFVLAALIFATLPVARAQSNAVLREVFRDIAGGTVADLTSSAKFIANTPDEETLLTSLFEAPTDVLENYGQRLRALITAPTTGQYTFWVASDDASDLYLSTDATPANKTRIAYVASWTASREWTKEANQQSAPRTLSAGQKYYIEVLMKEGGGGDNLAVRWLRPGGVDEAPINLTNCVPYGVGPPVITAQPANVSVAEGGTAAFSVTLARVLGATYQWHSNGVRVVGATNASFTVAPAALAASGSTYRVGVTNSYGGTNSTIATLTVTPDTTRPTLATVSAIEANVVSVIYSEPVEAVSGTNIANYAVTPGITIQSARFGADTKTVILSVTPLASGVTYTLTVNNVRDRATTPNTILANSTRTFSLNSQPLPIGYLFPGAEQIGPSRRRSPLVISEVMYNPTNRADLRNLEYIEIYNSQAWSEDISGYEITGEVNYTFPANTVMAARSYLVVAGNPADFVAGYGGATSLGPFVNTNKLDNGSGTVRLRNDRGAVLVEFEYRNDPPWPLAADGAGHSLVLARPSYGEDDPRAWAASVNPGGSPRVAEPAPITTFNTILINEVLAHTDLPQEDYIELYNYSTVSVNIGGLALTDDPDTNKFIIPGGTTIGPRSFLAFTETQLGFALNNDGETLFLRNGFRVVDAVKYEGQENGKPWGRFPDGTPAFHAVRNATQGTNNTALYVNDIVINEIMYAPISGDSGDEFIELKNKGTNAVNVGGWKFTDGIDFKMPASVTIPAGGYLVVAKNAARLRTNYAGLTLANCLGDYDGTLANGGERVALSFPDDVASTNQFGQWVTNKIWIVADEVTYSDGGRWGRTSDEGGSSLELADARADNRLAANWRDSDESQKSPWVTLEWTGTLDNGNGGLDRVHLFLLGEGECLVDNVEAIQGGTDRISNGNFEGGQAGWTFQGTHAKSFIENSGGFSGKCLHVVASARGDTGANRIWTATTTAFAGGQPGTLRAKVRFLRGHPELLLRIKGAWLEASTNHIATKRFGTPGAVNSATLAVGGNAGPAIGDVKHTPVLPTASQAVTVSALVNDPDGLSSLILNYRIDPATNFTGVAMTNNGAGYYSASIPGQASGTMAAFFIQASDNGTPLGATLFPNDAPVREALIRWGEPQPGGTLGQYHIWITTATANYWSAREKNSNEPLDCSFVYGTNRIIYNGKTLYAGSPWHAPGFSGPMGGICDYVFRAPDDDPVLGHDDFALASPGNLNSDPAYSREQMAFFVLRKMGEPYLYRRFVRLYVNGQQRGTLYEDTQQPGGDWAEQWFPDDPNGDLHKIEDWFEFADSGDSFNFNVDATLQNFTTDAGAKKLARYRWNWRKRAVQGSANNFTNLFALVDAVNSPQPAYSTLVPQLVDLSNWGRVFAMQRIAGNWDSYGMGRGKNCYAYKPDDADRPWKLCPWDIDFVFDNGGNSATDGLFGANDPLINTLQGWAPFRREMYSAYSEAANQILIPTVFNARVDAIYNGLLSEGISLDAGAGMKSYIATRRTTILNDIAANASAPMAITLNGGANFSTNRNLIQITGTAPVGVKNIRINGIEQNVTWTGVNSWALSYTLNSGANALNVAGLDRNDVTFTNDTITITYTGPAETPQDKLVINEIMYNPLAPNSAYIELWNRSAQNAFDLSNWRLEGVDFTFSDGSFINAGQYKIIVANTAGFQAAFGAGIIPLGEWNGTLDSGGETLTLWQWVATPTTTNYVMVDQVFFDDVAPWSAAADGSGPSLQLIDATRDNRRVANWGIGSTNVSLIPTQTLVRFTNLWRYNETADLSASSWMASSFNDSGWPQGLGLLYVENAALPEPKNTALTIGRSTYYFRTRFNFTGTPGQYQLRLRQVVDDGLVIYLNGSELYRLGVPAGQDYNTPADRSVTDATYEGPFILSAANLVAGTNVLAVEVHQILPSSTDVVLGVELIAEPLGAGGSTAQYSPGAANSIAAARPDFPTVWLNELQTYNTAGPADRFGDRDPWVELYNAGTNTIDLSTYYLADSYTNLTRWPFPAGTTLAPGAFRIVWLDGEPAETGAGELHANFRAPLTTGTVALVTLYNGSNTVMDYYNWDFSSPNRSLGSFPDGNPCQRRSLAIVTPGATNNPAFPPVAVFINEWLAQNSTTLADPVDGHFEDWVELYNAESVPVDIGDYYLTDTLTDKTKWKIPNNTIIPAGGFLLIWTDNENNQNNDGNPDRHASFQLAAGGEEIGLFTETGLQVDAIVFGPQLNDVSQGRFPDGAGTIYSMTNRTPRSANIVAGGGANQPPVLTGIGNRTAIEGQTLAFNATATDPNAGNTLTFTLDPGAPAGASISTGGAFNWLPTEAQGGANYNVTVRVTDNGSPALSDFETFSITVLKTNSPPTLNIINNQNVVEQQLLTFTATASDPDQPAQNLIFTLDPGAPAGATISTSGVFTWTPTEAQGTNQYSIIVRVTDDDDSPKSTFQSVILFVAESNQPPVLAAIGNKSVSQGQMLNFTLSATDADLPANTFTYSMSGAPAGATLNTNTGAFSWAPTNGGTFNVTFGAQDNGVPIRTDNEAIQIVVTETNAPPTISAPTNLFMIVEGTLLTFTNTANDANSGQLLSFALAAGAPAGAAVNATNGVFTWTPSEAQGPSSNNVSIIVSDNGTPSLSATQVAAIVVTEANSAPVLAAIGDRNATEGVQLAFTATATDPDLPANGLTFTLGGGAPAGASITAGGNFTWTPTEAQGPGVYSVTVIVTDNGTPVMTDSETIQITVSEVNAPPLMTVPTNSFVVIEGNLLSSNASGSDNDVPAQTLTFSLATGAPAGAAITAGGTFTWTPTEAQGPFSNTVGIVVTDNGSPNLSATQLVTVVVLESNTAPALTLATNTYTVAATTLLAFTANGTDTDAPANTLTYSLAGAPAGASIGANNGAFTWTPTSGQAPSTNVFNIVVADNGLPALSVTQMVTVIVTPFTGPVQLVSITNVWRYQEDGADLGTAWRNTNYNDSAWPQGAALLYIETAALPAPANTPLMLNGTNGAQVNTYYFRTHFTLSGSPLGVQLIASNVIDDGAVFYLNGVEAGRFNLSANPVLSTDFADGVVNNAVYTFTNLDNAALRQGDNVLAVEVHQVNLGSTDIVFGMSLHAVFPTNSPIVITTQPTNQSVVVNSPVSFTVIANGAAPQYQWFKDGAPISGANAATFSLASAQFSDAGTYFVRVSNDVNTAFSSNAVLTVAQPPNDPPVLTAIGNRTVVEGTFLSFTATATDLQAPPQTLTFSLDPGAPAGAAITGAGAFTWTPTEAQGPGSYNVTIRVTDNGSPALDDNETITITVLETNAAPVLTVIANRTVITGDYITFTNSATDSDLPTNALAYSLGVGAPVGTSIQTLSGQFEWTVPMNQPVGTNTITIIVTDNGTPALSHSRTFDVIIAAPLRITSIVEAGGSVTITAAAIPGRSYTLVTRDDLGPVGSWNVVGTAQTATGTSVSFSASVNGGVVQRFYRVLLLP